MENKRTPEISLIIPVFNEVSMINEVAIAAQAAMDSIRLPNEIIVVNDGSTDGTGDALRDIPFVRVITHPYNKGNGASVKTGIRAALGHTLVLMDGDVSSVCTSVYMEENQLRRDDAEYSLIPTSNRSPTQPTS